MSSSDEEEKQKLIEEIIENYSFVYTYPEHLEDVKNEIRENLGKLPFKELKKKEDSKQELIKDIMEKYLFRTVNPEVDPEDFYKNLHDKDELHKNLQNLSFEQLLFYYHYIDKSPLSALDTTDDTYDTYGNIQKVRRGIYLPITKPGKKLFETPLPPLPPETDVDYELILEHLRTYEYPSNIPNTFIINYPQFVHFPRSSDRTKNVRYPFDEVVELGVGSVEEKYKKSSTVFPRAAYNSKAKHDVFMNYGLQGIISSYTNHQELKPKPKPKPKAKSTSRGGKNGETKKTRKMRAYRTM
jgi:hypothetical protein